MSLEVISRNSTNTPLQQADLDHLTDIKATANKTASNISEPTSTLAQSMAVPANTATALAIAEHSTSETINIVDLSTAETATTVSKATTLPTAETNVPIVTTVPAATTLPSETVLTAATNGDAENKLLLLIGGKDAAGKPYTNSELIGQYRWAPQFFRPVMDILVKYTRQENLY
jgi:hypothetical protein